MTHDNTLCRSQQPFIHPIALPQIVEFASRRLANGVMFHSLSGGTQEIAKIDIVTKSGVQFSDKACVAAATNTLIGEGTKNFTAKHIAEQLDFCGAFIAQKSSNFCSIITVAVMSKHLTKVLPLLAEMIKCATFPQREFDTYIDKTLQELAINLQTPSYLAKLHLKELVYAEGSRYARTSSEAALRALSTDDLKRFYNLTYTPEDAHVFVSGLLTQNDIDLVADTFSDTWRPVQQIGYAKLPEYRPEPQTMFVEMPEAQQVSISMGQRFHTIDHEDNYGFSVLDTILGGYFGSRLMQSIREEKGLTYGIGSSIANNQYTGMHVIGSDVHPAKVQQVIDEIGNEMNKLRTEPVGSDELETVRNYMKGDLLRQFDSVLASADTLSNLMTKGLDSEHIIQMYNTVSNITAEELMELANKYLWLDRYCISMAGKKI